ncbi:MAG: ABC-F family ATP-binding cassette domain-containing protein [Oligoflexia bacterium]|nr:ABC-F family ATP-binding cassette domain-containing protein [Oligoflexia bacterium]
MIRNGRIDINNIAFKLDNGIPLLKDMSLSVCDRSIGLIGKNGTGKTTLLRLIIGEISPNSGRILTKGNIGYLPQKVKRCGHTLVKDFLEVAQVVSDLNLIESNMGGIDAYERMEGKWDKIERCQEVLQKLGLSDISLERSLDTLSGGELIRLNLCALILKEPDILLLDEPTNNLDYKARKYLIDFLNSWNGVKLVATHDRELLDTLDSVAELHEGKCNLYEMKYSDYRIYREQQNNSAKEKYQTCEKHLAEEKNKLQEVLNRRRHRTADAEKRARKDTGVQRLGLKSARSNAENSTARLKEIHLKRIEDCEEDLATAREQIRDENKIEVDIQIEEIPSKKEIINIRELNISFDSKSYLWSTPITFSLMGPTRIAITGSNGSGKTTLLKLIEGQITPSLGTIKVSVKPIVYLSQFIECLNPEQTILRNVQNSSSNFSESLLRTRLARLFFKGDTVHKQVSCLSGGELLKAALAKLFCSDIPPKLLILDEPTNHLDIDSLEQLESALNNFKAAMIVVSHDFEFSRRIGVTEYLDLDEHL